MSDKPKEEKYLNGAGLIDYDAVQKKRFEQINTSFENVATKENQQTIIDKLDNEIKPNLGGVNDLFYIYLTCSKEYDTHTFTATSQINQKAYTAVVTDGKAIIKVGTPGGYEVTNDLDENSRSVEFIDTFIEEVSFNNKNAIFGVRVTQSESDPKNRVTYTDDAVSMSPVTVDSVSGKANLGDWKNTWIFDKIYPVMLKTDGTVAYKLNPEDVTKKLEGGNSEISSTSFDGNAMVCIEKFYLKMSTSGGYENIQISDTPKAGFEAIGFKRADGTEMDRVYMPMYMGSYDSSSKLRSLSGQAVKASTSYIDFLAAAQKNGSNYGLEAHPQITLLDALYLILFKNDNCQDAIGKGRGVPDATTGVTNSLGAIGCDPTTEAVRFMWMEDYFFSRSSGNEANKKNENGYRWMEGWIFQNSKIYVKMSRPYSYENTNGYTEVPGVGSKGGYISASIADNKYGRIGSEFNGSDTTYQCDYQNYNTGSTLYVCVRGLGGLFSRDYDTPSNTPTYIGAALSFEPPQGA